MSKKIKDCIKEGMRGERHKGLKIIQPSDKKVHGHIKKALHNYKAMLNFKKNGFSDWSASAAFYCLYHCLLAIISKHGFESRNQSCTLALVEYLIEKGKVNLSKMELQEIFDKDVTESLQHSRNILDIRENIQYSIRTSLEELEFLDLKERTKKIFDRIRRDIED